MLNFLAGLAGGGVFGVLVGLVVGTALAAIDPPRHDLDGPDCDED